MGLDRLELSTSVLSGPRSNRLSYRPTKGYDKLYPLGVLVSSGVYRRACFPLVSSHFASLGEVLHLLPRHCKFKIEWSVFHRPNYVRKNVTGARH